jgi:hypothetical protein
MKKLTKGDKAGFERVCKIIRDALHLEHWEKRYSFNVKAPDAETYAESKTYKSGRRLWICIYPKFWTLEPEIQLTTLIHEHLHVLHSPVYQVIDKIIDWTHESDRRAFDLWNSKADEHVIDHLTSAVYDLLKNRF